MASVVLGVRMPLKNFHRSLLSGINLSDKIEALRSAAASKINLRPDEIELVYCGNALSDDATIKSCGIKDGVMVHVLKKREPETPVKPREVSETELVQLVFAFRTMLLSSSFRNAIQKFSRTDVLENMIAATPGLADDPVALAMVQDPELMVHLADMDTVKRISEFHPALIEVANHIAASLHNDTDNATPSTNHLSGYSYSLDALSDEDDMDSSQSSDTQARHSNGMELGRQGSFSGITQAQLAAALAAATGSPSSSSSSVPSTSSQSNRGVITSEMLSHAMQQAVANIGTTNLSSQNLTAAEAATRQLILRQLQQMRELGIVDDALSLRALEATDGDVQAAVELIFSGWIGEDAAAAASNPPSSQ